MSNGNGWNPWQRTDEINAQIDYLSREYVAQGDAAPPLVPHSPAFRHSVVPQNGIGAAGGVAGMPATIEATLERMVAAQERSNQLAATIVAQNNLLIRMTWIRFCSDASISATGAELPVSGSSGAAYSAATYVPFYINRREYPVGIRITAIWNTPGGKIKFSLNTGDNGLVAELQNGGPNGGVVTPTIVLNPGQTLFAANGDPIVPIGAADIFRLRIVDIGNNIKPDVFRTLPWSL